MILADRKGASASAIGLLRRLVLGFSTDEVDFEKRGFHLGDPGIREAAETAGRAAIVGYNLALELGQPWPVAERVEMFERYLHPYAYEGAAIGLMTLDGMTPRRGDRALRLVEGPGAAHLYPVLAGIGMALGGLRRALEPTLEAVDRHARWMIPDGVGFLYGHTWTRWTIEDQNRPSWLEGYAARCFDHGVGRSLWMVCCGTADPLRAAIDRFPEPRRPDLWAGVAMAATHLGGWDERALKALVEAGGPSLVRGVALGVEIHSRAGTSPAHLEVICQAVTGRSAREVQQLNEEADRADADGDPGFERWRAAVEASLS